MSDIEQTDEYRRGYLAGIDAAIAVCEDKRQKAVSSMQFFPASGCVWCIKEIEKLKGGAE